MAVPASFLARNSSLAAGLILAAGLAARLAIAPMGAHPGDFATLTGWAQFLGGHTLLAVYTQTDANYPPLSMALLAASRWLYGLLYPGDPAGAFWMVMLKLPSIMADMGIGWLAWRRSKSPWVTAAAVFNPALFYLSAWWGQYENVYMLAVLAAALCAVDRHYLRAGLWLGAGVMVKLQAGVMLPVVAIAALTPREGIHMAARSMLRLIAGAAAPAAICLGPFAAAGQSALVAARLVAVVGSPGWLTINALNVWYLATGGSGNWRYNAPLVTPDSTPILGGVSAHDIGLIALGGWCAIALGWLAWRRLHAESRDGASMLWAGALLYLGVFLFPTQAHERYSLGAVVLLGAATILGLRSGLSAPAAWLCYADVTLLHALNLVWAAAFSPGLEGWFSGSTAWGMAIAAGFVALSGWMLSRFRPDRAM